MSLLRYLESGAKIQVQDISTLLIVLRLASDQTCEITVEGIILYFKTNSDVGCLVKFSM